MKGEQIRMLSGLVNAAHEKRAVIVPGFHPWEKPRPAAFVLQLSGEIIYGLLNQGMYIYERKVKDVNARRGHLFRSHGKK